jgi:flagellar motor switch/type III secretory pathway protein FliN
LARLELGDVILLGVPIGQEKKLTVKLLTKGKPGLAIFGVLTEQSIAIIGVDYSEYTTTKVENNERLDMNENKRNPLAKSNSELLKSTELSAINVEIDIELARISIPISALQQLSVGQVFNTDKSVDGDDIALWCCGQRLGVGQLVAIGDSLGIRIVELNSIYFGSTSR